MKRTFTFPTAIAVVATIALVAAILFSCDRTKTSIRVLGRDGTPGTELSREDAALVERCLSAASYDSLLNNGGIKVKMVDPDYTLVVSGRGGPSHDPEKANAAQKPGRTLQKPGRTLQKPGGASDDRFVQIWAVSARVLDDSKWYFLKEEDIPALVNMLEKYRD